MGEILRAVLQQNCVASRPRWYGAGIELTVDSNGNASADLITQFDRTGYFLLTGIFPWGGSSFRFNIKDLTSGQDFFKSSPAGNVGPAWPNCSPQPLSQNMLQEYRLFEPGERIQFHYSYVGPNQPYFIPVQITYSGIEYLMPGGPPQ